MLNNNQNTSPAMQHIEIEKLPVKYFSSAVCMGHIRSGFLFTFISYINQSLITEYDVVYFRLSI